MLYHKCPVLLFGTLLIGVLLGDATTGLTAEPEIQPVTRTAPHVPTALPPVTATAPATPQVTFAQLPAQVGDRVAQSVDVDLQLHTTITQSGQQANDSQTSLKRRQQRYVEVLEVAAGNVRRVHVTYPLARMSAPKDNSDSAQEVTQPVEKKSYLVTREGKRLLVTDTEGAIPSQAEYEIVVTSLQNLGLENPLIKFLVGRTVHVGERMQLPQAIAEQVMGLGDQFSKVEQFVLELKSVREIDGQPCAVFAATVEAVGEAASPVRIHAFGQMVIQTQTCRTVRAELSGPLTLSAVEHTPGGHFQFSARGNMHLKVLAQYGHAQQKRASRNKKRWQ